MRAPEGVVRIVAEWVQKAENDLTNASHTLEMGEACPTDTVCFHAQQCVEKFLKALMTLAGRDSPRTHDVELLLAGVPKRLRPTMSEDERDRLTEYATITRYPGDYDPISLTEARRAVELARRVRDDVRSRLPAGARGD